MDKKYAMVASAFVVIGLSLGAILTLGRQGECNAVSVGGDIGGAFTLVDQFGQEQTDRDVIDGPSLVYFGYTYCPDVCPFDMARNVAAVDALGQMGHAVTPIFITIDPARDTVAALSDYASVMHPDMIALTGSQTQIDQATRTYRVYAARVSDDEDYLMDHSTFTYYMTPDGFQTFFRREATVNDISADVACLIDRA